MKKKYLECESCHKKKPDVRVRACGYADEINNNPNKMEQICDDCEHEHIMDI